MSSAENPNLCVFPCSPVPESHLLCPQLSDITRVLDSQACTGLASRVLRSFIHLQLAGEATQVCHMRFAQLTFYLALPPTFKWGYNVQSSPIHRVNDDVLLNIFNCYRLDEEDDWNVRLLWCKLSQVCQRWRHLIYDCASHLSMHIECTNGTPIVDTLDHLPPLPLVVDYKTKNKYSGATVLTERDQIGILNAIRLHDRVRLIDLDLPPSILYKVLALMDRHFPILEHLSLSFSAENSIHLTLPKAFMAPNIRHISIPSINLSKRLRLLTSTISLVTLKLKNMQSSSYFRPRLLVARLSSLPQLEELSIEFSVPIPRPSTEMELLGEEGTPVTLPNLQILCFKGVSAYLESLVAQIRVPLLERLGITLFNQIAFVLPHLYHLINITEAFKLPTATVYFHHDEVSVVTAHHSSRQFFEPLCLRVKCKQLDWQIDCVGQICNALIPTLSAVERFTLELYYRNHRRIPTELQNGAIDSTTWHELLRSFIGVEDLHIDHELLEELSRALQVDEVGSEPGFLPHLQFITAEDDKFTSFIHARKVVGRPVRFRWLPPPLQWSRAK